MVCKNVNLVHRRSYERTGLSTKRSTKQVGPCTIIEVSIPIGQPVFAKINTSLHILISAGCIQTVIRILGIKRIPPWSQSMAQQNGTKVLQAIACHCMPLHHVNCITLHPPKLHGCSSNIFETRALFVCLLQGVHVAANKMSYGSYFIFLGCFQDVLTSDPIQVKDVMQLIVCKEVMHRHVWRAWRQQIKNWKKHGRDWENAKQESSHYSIFLKMEKLRTTCKARTHSKRDITEWTIYDYIISMIYKEVQQERKLERGKRQKQVLQGTHPAKASSPTRPAWRHDMSYI